MTTKDAERTPPTAGATPAQHGPRRRALRLLLVRADWPAALLFVALAALLPWLTLLPVTQRTVRLAEAPGWVGLAGFYGPERNDAFSYRWSGPDARLTLPVPPADRYAITLTLGDGPGAAGDRPLAISVDGAPLATVYPDAALREYRIIYARPGGAAGDAPLDLRLQIPPRAAAGDGRALGVVVARVRWEVAGASAAARAGLLAAQVALLGLAYAALRALRRGRGATPLLVAYGGAALLYWLATSLHPALIVALAALGLLLAVRRAPPPALRPLAAPAGQRWLLLIAALGIWASAPTLIERHNPGDQLRGYAALLLAGALTVPWLHPRRPALALGGGALAALLAAAWWRWRAAPALVALPALQPYDAAAIRLVPWVVVACAAAACALAALLPAPAARRVLAGGPLLDLAALLLPAGLWLAGRGEYSEIERTLRASWPGGFLVLLVIAQALLLGAALWRGADGVATERRMALAVLALVAAVAGSLAPWRMAAFGLSGDESGYLAAALSLARDRDLELTNNGYAPWMLARVQYPGDAWGHEFPDTARDRFAAQEAAPAARHHALPVVAGPTIHGQIGIANPSATDARITLRIDGPPGAPGTEERFTLAPRASRLVPIPAAADWRGATIEASAPVAVAARLVADGGALDAYGAAPPARDACFPFPALPPDAEALLALRNDGDRPATVVVTRRGGAGEDRGGETAAVPAGATLRLPLPAQPEAHAVCVAADAPLAALALVRLGESGLLALPAPAATAAPLPIPAAPTTTRARGTLALVAHNPNDAPVVVRRAGGDGPPLATIPPRGTAQVPLAPGGAAATVVAADGPLVASFLLALDRHRALLAPATGAATAWFPAIVGESRRFVATGVALQNPGDAPLAVAVALLDDGGAARVERRLTLCGRCAVGVRLDFADADGFLIDADGAIVVAADRPVLATVGQIAIASRDFQHEWGLPALLAPGVALGGLGGALLTVAACGALLVAQLYGLCRDAGIARRAALAACLALGLAPPILPFSLLLYPEIPATLLLITGLRLALGSPPPRGWRLAGAAGCAVAIPLLHTRLLPLALALALCAGWRAAGIAALDRRARRILLIVLAAPVALVALWWLASPFLPPVLALSGRLAIARFGGYFSADRFWHHLAGLTLDRATGLLPAAPLLLLAPAGLIGLARRAPRHARWPGLLIALQTALVALRGEGWEAWGPPGRYLLPVVPLLALGVAGAWADWSPRWLRFAGAALAAWGWLAAAFLAWVPHAPYYFLPDGKWFGDLLLRAWGWPNPLRLFPDIKAARPFDPLAALPWFLLAIAVVAAGVRWRATFAPRPDLPPPA